MYSNGVSSNHSNISSLRALKSSIVDLAPIKSEVQSEQFSSINTGIELQRAEVQGMRVSVGEEQLIKAIDRAVQALQGPNTTFEVSRHAKINAITIKVFNKDTGELIREIPPEKTLDLVAKMMEIAGILIDERV